MARRFYEKMEVVYVPGKGLTPLPKDEADALLEPVIETLKARRTAREAKRKQENIHHSDVVRKKRGPKNGRSDL